MWGHLVVVMVVLASIMVEVVAEAGEASGR